MKNMIKFAGIVAAAFALTQSVQATAITGSIGFSGIGVTLDNSSASTATAVTSWIAPVVSGDAGSFAVVANNTPAVFTAPWNFNTGSSVNPFWAVGGFTFNLLSSSIVSQGGTAGVNGFVVVSGVGVVSGNSFDPTAMTWSFTTQDPSSGLAANGAPTWSFSASANTAVPDGGATVMLLGIALSGLALLKKKLTA
jgi:hypothetical protein